MVVLLVLISIKIIINDIRVRIIENSDILILSCLVLLSNFDSIGMKNIESLFLILGAGFLLFCLKVCGAGDVKLAAVMSLGVGSKWFLLTVFMMFWFGGLLATIYFIKRIINKKHSDSKVGIPYAVPIVLSFLLGMWLTSVSG